MTRIAPVNLALSPKTYWFDAGDLEIEKDDAVVVKTARGVEMGFAAKDVFEPSEEELADLSTSLQPVLRIASEEDVERYHENERLSKEALVTFKEIARKHNDEMHPVAVEFLLDNDKAIFYFESERRLDFRDIVRDLVSTYHVRVDMRQIGIRDEARMIGGYGHCGQELCCKRLGGEFCPVSIRMAKEQSLSLNPQKISGCCGRLMCCLRYEYDNYKGFNGRAPKLGGRVHTPDGDAKVSHIDALREIIDVRVQIDGKDKTVHVPLSGFLPPEGDAKRPNTVSDEAWEEALKPPEISFESSLFFSGSTANISGADKVGEVRAVRRNRANAKNITGSASMVKVAEKSKRRRRRRGSDSGFTPTDEELSAVEESRPKRRRRSTTMSADGVTTTTRSSAEDLDGETKKGTEAKRRSRRSRSGRSGSSSSASGAKTERKAVRPGQKSSSLSNPGEASRADAGTESTDKPKRRRRRRGSRGKGGKSSPKPEGQSQES